MIRALQRRKTRQQERAFVVEGLRAVEDVLLAGMAPRAVYVRADYPHDRLPMLPQEVIPRVVERKLFDSLTDLPHPQGILAIVPMLDEPEIPVPSRDFAPIVLLIDGVRDPGNLGTLLRSAAGAGADHVVIGPESVDPYHPRAVRAAMGAHARQPFSRRSWEALRPVLEAYSLIALADASGEQDYDLVDWTCPSVIVVGGEAFGPTGEAWDQSTTGVRIPLDGGIESLNAGVAGSLLLFEASRQRRVANRAQKG